MSLYEKSHGIEGLNRIDVIPFLSLPIQELRVREIDCIGSHVKWYMISFVISYETRDSTADICESIPRINSRVIRVAHVERALLHKKTQGVVALLPKTILHVIIANSKEAITMSHAHIAGLNRSWNALVATRHHYTSLFPAGAMASEQEERDK